MVRNPGEAVRISERPHAVKPAEQAVVTVDFRNSRRDVLLISTSENVLNFVIPSEPFSRRSRFQNRLLEYGNVESRP